MKRDFLCHLLLVWLSCQAVVHFASGQCNFNGQIRLVGGSTQYEGRVEICMFTQWGTVCDNMWDATDATVVCRNRGFATTGAVAFSSAFFGQGSGPIHITDVRCTGTETRLSGCPYNTNTGGCSHSGDAGVRCQVIVEAGDIMILIDFTPKLSGKTWNRRAGFKKLELLDCNVEPLTCAHGDIRLMDGSSDMEGRVEVCLSGVWGTVCSNGWTAVDANVACRQLGYSGSDATPFSSAATFGQGAGLIALNNVACTAYESRLIDCPYTNSTAGCSHANDVGANCSSRCVNGSIRVMGGSSSMEGRVEVCQNGDWGTVCDDGWTTVDANIACRQLGFSNSDATAYSGARFGQGSSLIITLDEVSCTGEEASLFSCVHTTSHDCTHTEDAAVLCSTQCTDGSVRLAAGTYSFEGRVEVCVNGVWGTVCHDLWSTSDAAVACRQLGYSTYEVLAYANAPFGQAQLPILLDDVSCTGPESRLVDCPYDRNTGDCSHSQDAGTRCHPIPTSVSLSTPVTGTANSGEVKYYNLPFHSSGITFRLDVFQGSVDAYASDVTDAPNTQRGHVWQIQTSSYDDLFFDPSSLGRRPGNTAYIAVEGRNSFNSFSVGAVSGNITTTALTTGTDVTQTVGGGTMNYYEIAFTNSGVTIKLDVMQGSATLYASDYIWNLTAESYDWRIQTNITHMYGEEFIHPSNLNRTAGNVLFLGVLGGETANVYILNNTLGDTTTKVPLAPSNIQLLAVDKTTATLMWTAPTPNIESPLSPIKSYQLILSTQQYGLSDIEVTVTTNFHKFVDIEEFTEYTCVVAATNGVGQGQFSSPFTFTTTQSAPVAPPQHASASSPTSTSINIMWQPPPAIDINGMIVFYVVEVTENRTGRFWTHHSPDSPTPFQQFTLFSLHPYYVYTCRVAAFTVGSGPFTPDFEVITMEDLPTVAPGNFIVTNVTSRTVSLSWDPLPIEQQNGLIRQYVIAANRTDNPPGFQLTSNTTALIVDDLSPYRNYSFAVAAETIGLGPFTLEVVVSLPEDEPDEPPQNLRGNATNVTTLTLTWDPPHIEEQNGIIREYLVNITEIETGETFLHSTPMTCITATGLHPFYVYESIVTAVTIGPGPYSSNFTIQMPQTVPNTSPLNFEGNATSSRSISLTWDPPLFEDQNGIITGYIINAVLNETAEDFQLSTAEPRLLLDSLRPFGTYSFVIAAQTIAGVGPFSTVLTIATPEDIPTEPRSIQVLSLAGLPTELLVTWDPPAEPNGILLSYAVYCYVLSNDSITSQPFLAPLDTLVTTMPIYIEVPGNQTEAVMEDLVPYTYYFCLVTANTSIGESNSSSIQLNRTDESVPDNPPSNFTATAINSTAIQLMWSEPPTPYGIVVSYNITYNLSDVIEIGSGMNLLVMDFTEMPVSLMVDAEDGNSYVVTGLNEYTIYQFEIFASTRIGPGPSTQATARTHDTNPHAPPQNIQSRVTGSKTAVINWDPPPFDDHNGIITYYLLLITQEQFNISDMVINTTSDVTTYTVTGLEEYNNYTCRVAAATRIGPGPYSAPIRFSTPQDAPTAPPQSPSAIAQGSRDIMLTWSPPPPIHINGIILYYRVRVTERETGRLFPFVTPLQQLPVHDLHPHYYYDCMVAAFTVGDGPFSSNFTVQTAEEPPSGSPSRPVVFASTPVSLTLIWTAPDFPNHNGIIRNYVIAIHEVETGRNFTESSNTTQVTLEPLHPYYTYMCSIAAETVGRGPFSLHVTEQLPEAAPASPPTNITGRATDSTTIVLSWSPPPPGDQNGIIRSYNISVLEQDTGREFSRTSGNTEESFHSLHPFYIYSVTITASTVAPGPPSSPIMVQTEEDIPSTPPLNVTVVDTTSELVTLIWYPPLREHRNGIITGYLINLTAEVVGNTLEFSSNTTNITVDDLMPYTTYLFIVAAETIAGSGPFSLIVSVRTEETAPSGAPQNLTVTALSPYSIFLDWFPPPPNSQNGVIREYRVNITEVETGTEFYFTTAATSYSVSNILHPYYTYECIVSAYTIAIGPYTDEVTVTTHEDVPTASPRNFVSANISSRSAILTWDPPPPEHQNGNITQYIINATVLQSNERLQFFSESTSLVVDTLTPYRTYILFVAASTSVGIGPFTTSIVTIQTPQDVPTSAPLNPMGVAVNSRTILLSWEPPPADQHNGVLRHYIIRVIEMETGQVRRYNSTTTSLQVPLLHPYYTYEWNVSAYTVGEGPHTNLSSVRTPQDIPSGTPTNLTGDATSHEGIFLSWDPPLFEEQNGVITGYTVNVTNLRREEMLQFTVMDSQNLSIGSLLPHTTYACIVAARTIVGVGPFSQQLLVRTLETTPEDSPTNIHGVSLNSTHILVRWDPPHEDRQHGVIREYHINVTGLDDMIMLQLSTDANVTHITVGSLHPFYRYTANVAAVTIGEGSSISVTVRTEEDAPASPPLNFIVRADTSRSLFFSWDPPLPEHQNGIIRHYVINITSIDGSFNVSTPTTQTNYTVLAPIRPFITYVCNIAAETVAVGPVSEDVSILTPQDVPQAPPQRLIANATNSRTLVLGWEPPDTEDRNGIILKYTINITELDTDMPLDFVIGNTTTLTVSVHPFYRYSYIIAAETIIGLGPYSMPPQVFQMPEDAPTRPPGELAASWINSSAFFLSWNAPPLEHQNGIIRSYTIHITEQNTSMELLLSSPTAERVVESVHPNYDYMCIVAATTIRLGPFSTSILVRTSEDVPNGPPTNVASSPVNSTSLNFTWGPPPLPNQNGIITGYTIRFARVNAREWMIYQSNISRITIGSLIPHTDYVVSVAAETRVGLGPYAANFTIMTPEDAPSAPPTFLNHSQLTAFSVHLEWIPPPSEYWNGIVRQYVLTRTELETGRNVATRDLARTEHTVGSLHPFYNYNFSVCAVTVIQGPCSDAYTVRTLEHIPTASPQNVQATPLSSTAFSLTWQPPPVDRQNGIILGYFINMTELDTGRHTQLIANTTSLSVNTGLHPFYRYHFVIAAETVIGRGPPSREHLARTLEDVPSGEPTNVTIQVLSSTSILLKWEPPMFSEQNGVISGYTILITSLQDGSVQQHSTTGLSLQSEGLRKYSGYRAAIASMTVIGTGPYFTTHNVTTFEDVPDAPGRLTSNSVTATTIALYWSPPENANGVLLGYQVIFQANQNSDRGTLSIAVNDQPSAVVANLMPGLRYEFKVRARTAVGYGENSTLTVEIPPEETPSPEPPVIDTTTLIIVGAVSAPAVLGMLIIACSICCYCCCRGRRTKTVYVQSPTHRGQLDHELMVQSNDYGTIAFRNPVALRKEDTRSLISSYSSPRSVDEPKYDLTRDQRDGFETTAFMDPDAMMNEDNRSLSISIASSQEQYADEEEVVVEVIESAESEEEITDAAS